MSVDTRALPAFFNTDADFQSFCQGIAAQIAIAGWIKTNDTGQINNATVSKPSATNTAQGYEIYKAGDSLQSSTPMFIKVEYGSGGTSAGRPSLWITAGTQTDGAGTLSNNTTRQQVASQATDTAGTTFNSVCSGDGSRLTLLANNDTSGNNKALLIVVERLRDGSGNATADGFIQLTIAGNANTVYQAVLGGSVQTAHTNAIGMAGTQTSTGTWGGGKSANNGATAVAPWVVLNGVFRYILSLAAANTSDVSNQATISVTTLNGAHTYITQTHLQTAFCQSGSDRLCLCYE